MNKQHNSRLQFIKNLAYTGAGISLAGAVSSWSTKTKAEEKTRVGMIGLDTSHCIAFAKLLNAPDASPEFGGYKIVAAYPKGSSDIKSSVERIPGYTEEIKQY